MSDDVIERPGAFSESEAKTKVCPFITEGKAHHPGGSDWKHVKCMASECMAWRWLAKPTDPYVERWGFCGLTFIASLPSWYMEQK
jgi:hypothetical protein